jgi:hypothetical protein
MTTLAILVLATETESSAWRYAGWIAVDLRLLLFLVAVSVFVGVGAAALWVRSGRWRDYSATFILAFFAALTILIAIFNGIASWPVFVVERLFPFP